MTENEIIERLEALVKNGFPFCADALNLIKHLKELDKKNENIIRLANKTIKSQSAEIEKKGIEIDILIRKKEALKDEVEQWKEEANKYQNLWCEAVKDIQTAKSEAIKEFAEKVDKILCLQIGPSKRAFWKITEDIKKLLKEMVGDDNA